MFAYHQAEVPIGRCYQAGTGQDRAGSSNSLKLSVLENSQELRLEFQGTFPMENYDLLAIHPKSTRMIIRHGREAAAPEDEKFRLDGRCWSDQTSGAHRYKGRGLIGGLPRMII